MKKRTVFGDLLIRSQRGENKESCVLSATRHEIKCTSIGKSVDEYSWTLQKCHRKAKLSNTDAIFLMPLEKARADAKNLAHPPHTDRNNETPQTVRILLN